MTHWKYISVILILTSCISHLGNEKAKVIYDEFSYKYFFSLDFENDTNSFQTSSLPIDSTLSKISGTITTTRNQPFDGIGVIKLINRFNSSIEYIDIRGNGKFEGLIEEGKYDFELSGGIYDRFLTEIEIKKGEELVLDIKLGRAAEDEVYEVHSKKEMSEREVLKIKNCEQENRLNFNIQLQCAEKDSYFIVVQI
ncbi:hypothetical protein [Owenweeksia hongkongensis]|uniref:hypothetical protein n=1 Tax=Owenweeksia hongkongensis TaxID=253245 RepID=UPI003A92AD69